MPNTPSTQHEWTVHSINIHGIFFERWCQRVVTEIGGWTLDSTNYPVEFPPPNGPFRGKESTLDIRASRDAEDIRLCLLVECKKNNPEFVDWVFFQKPAERSRNDFIVSQVQNNPRTLPATGWDTVSSVRQLSTQLVIADEARETRANYLDWKNSGNKTKTSNAAIHDAAYQVSLAKQAIAHEDDQICRRAGSGSSAGEAPFRTKLYFPTIVTTARLLLCEFDAKDVDATTGEIDPARVIVAPRRALVFEYPLPRHFQFQPTDIASSYKEGLADLFTRLHILVVQSDYLGEFLQDFYGEAKPTDPTTTIPPETPSDAQPAVAGGTR